MTINARLSKIQMRMHVPKDKRNEFGGYKYRNAEDIIAAFKALEVYGASLRCVDTLQDVGGQIFVSAEAILSIDDQSVSATGHAMHPLQKKGMDASQITGSASSYARKYALCGLFAIEDESQDPDSRDNRKEQGQTPPPPCVPAPEAVDAARDSLASADTLERLKAIWTDLPKQVQSVPAVIKAKDARKAEIDKQKAPPANDDLGGDKIPY